MSLATLEAGIESALAKARELAQVKAPANPMSMLGSDGMFVSDDRGYGGANERDQLEHYRGRYYSATRIIVHRFSSQGIYVARRGVTSQQRSVSSMVHKGYIPTGGVPQWIANPDNLEVLDSHPLISAIDNPNRLLTRFNMLEMVSASIMVTGRGFIVAFPSEQKGRALDLYAVPATWMRPVNSSQQEWKIKPPSSNAKPIIVSASQVAYFYFSDPSNPAGVISPLSMVGRAVLTDESISAVQYNEFKNGAMPKVALIAGDVMNETGFSDSQGSTTSARPVRLEPEQRRQIITWFQQQYAGAQKYGLPLVLDAIIRDVKMLSRTPAEMAFLESANLTKEQIYEGVGVSKVLSGQLETVTRASASVAEQLLADNVLNPVINLFSQACTKTLCPLFALDGEELVMWMAPLVPRDTELDIEMLKLARLTYSATRNEFRDVLRRRFGGFPRLEGWDDVVMPQTLDERDENSPAFGIGRVGT